MANNNNNSNDNNKNIIINLLDESSSSSSSDDGDDEVVEVIGGRGRGRGGGGGGGGRNGRPASSSAASAPSAADTATSGSSSASASSRPSGGALNPSRGGGRLGNGRRRGRSSLPTSRSRNNNDTNNSSSTNRDSKSSGGGKHGGGGNETSSSASEKRGGDAADDDDDAGVTNNNFETTSIFDTSIEQGDDDEEDDKSEGNGGSSSSDDDDDDIDILEVWDGSKSEQEQQKQHSVATADAGAVATSSVSGSTSVATPVTTAAVASTTACRSAATAIPRSARSAARNTTSAGAATGAAAAADGGDGGDGTSSPRKVAPSGVATTRGGAKKKPPPPPAAAAPASATATTTTTANSNVKNKTKTNRFLYCTSQEEEQKIEDAVAQTLERKRKTDTRRKSEKEPDAFINLDDDGGSSGRSNSSDDGIDKGDDLALLALALSESEADAEAAREAPPPAPQPLQGQGTAVSRDEGDGDGDEDGDDLALALALAAGSDDEDGDDLALALALAAEEDAARPAATQAREPQGQAPARNSDDNPKAGSDQHQIGVNDTTLDPDPDFSTDDVDTDAVQNALGPAMRRRRQEEYWRDEIAYRMYLARKQTRRLSKDQFREIVEDARQEFSIDEAVLRQIQFRFPKLNGLSRKYLKYHKEHRQDPPRPVNPFTAVGRLQHVNNDPVSGSTNRANNNNRGTTIGGSQDDDAVDDDDDDDQKLPAMDIPPSASAAAATDIAATTTTTTTTATSLLHSTAATSTQNENATATAPAAAAALATSGTQSSYSTTCRTTTNGEGGHDQHAHYAATAAASTQNNRGLSPRDFPAAPDPADGTAPVNPKSLSSTKNINQTGSVSQNNGTSGRGDPATTTTGNMRSNAANAADTSCGIQRNYTLRTTRSEDRSLREQQLKKRRESSSLRSDQTLPPDILKSVLAQAFSKESSAMSSSLLPSATEPSLVHPGGLPTDDDGTDVDGTNDIHNDQSSRRSPHSIYQVEVVPHPELGLGLRLADLENGTKIGSRVSGFPRVAVSGLSDTAIKSRKRKLDNDQGEYSSTSSESDSDDTDDEENHETKANREALLPCEATGLIQKGDGLIGMYVSHPDDGASCVDSRPKFVSFENTHFNDLLKTVGDEVEKIKNLWNEYRGQGKENEASLTPQPPKVGLVFRVGPIGIGTPSKLTQPRPPLDNHHHVVVETSQLTIDTVENYDRFVNYDITDPIMYGRRKRTDVPQQNSTTTTSPNASIASPMRTRQTASLHNSHDSSRSTDNLNDHILGDKDAESCNSTAMRADEEEDDTYERALDTFRTMFCPQCMTYDCTFHCRGDFDAGTQAAVASELEENNKDGYWQKKETLWARSQNEAFTPSTEVSTNVSTAELPASSPNDDLCVSESAVIKSIRITLRRPERVARQNADKNPTDIPVVNTHELTRFQKWTVARMLTAFDGDYTRLQRATGKDFTASNLPVTPFASYPSSSFRAKSQKKRNKYGKDVTKRVGQPMSESQTFFFPCYHDGPCTKENECTCIVNNFVCTPQCIWGPFSSNYFRGCECLGRCDEKACPCRASFRECILDVCHCGGNTCDIDSACCNMMCTLGRRSSLVLAPSTIPNAGWGLFAAKRICIGDYIDEYVGEPKDTEKEDDRPENYLFGHTSGYFLDSLEQGGCTRYINHSSESPNMEARSIFTNGGEKRIAFFASKYINAGQELFYDYGKKYKSNWEGKEEREAPPTYCVPVSGAVPSSPSLRPPTSPRSLASASGESTPSSSKYSDSVSSHSSMNSTTFDSDENMIE